MATSAAQQLWDARVNASKIPTDFDGQPSSEEEGYALQAAMVAASGEDIIGWKIGATVAALFPVLGVSQPFLGPLFQRFTYDSGAEIPILPGHALETEVTVRLKADLPVRDTAYTRDEVEAAVGAVIPSFELVGARFEGELAGAGFKVIADGGANVGTVLSSDVTDWGPYDLSDHPISLTINGANAIEGSVSVLVWDHVFDALSWCLERPALVPRGLKAGDIVMTGTCTGMTPLNPGDEAVGNFGPMGEVCARFV